MSGILGSFDDAMAALTAGEVDDHDGTVPGGCDEPGRATPAARTAAPIAAIGPRVLPAAQAVADRLLGCAGFELVDGTGASLTISRVPVTIGRSRDPRETRLVVEHATVSRDHCRVVLAGRIPTVADLGSANGTCVRRGDEIVPVERQPVELLAGDTITTARGEHTLAAVTTRAGGA